MKLEFKGDNSAPSFEKRYLKKVKQYDPNLDIVWNKEYERWALQRFAEGQWHHCFFLNNEDGSYRPVDDRLLEEIYECDLWRHFGNDKDAGGKLHDFIQFKKNDAQLKEKNLRAEYLKWDIKEHKNEWKQAIENYKRGIIHIPEMDDRKIIITG